MLSRPFLRAAAAALVLVAMAGAGNALAAPAAQVFVPVAKPDAVDARWRTGLCALIGSGCSPGQLELYRPRGGEADAYVVLSAQPLAMARVRRTQDEAGWRLEQLHDFSAYRDSPEASADSGDGEGRRSLAPALYPLADGRWAVAVLRSVSESYSGGGAGFTTADFVPLDGDPATARAVHRAIPFSCSKMVRACFSEKEYKTSPHCHDETDGSLRIGYGEPARPGDGYRWKFSWIEHDWPAHQPQRAMRTSTTRFTDASVDTVPFCGGPQ